MNDDFVTRLQLQLREAAEREARRGRFARGGAAVRWGVASSPALAGLALACALALVIAIAATRSTPQDTPRPAEPPLPPAQGLRMAARVPLVSQGGSVAPGFGSVWASDGGTGEVLRVDPRTRRVIGRVRVGGQPFVSVGAGAVWATAGRQVSRIDPETNRVTARIPLRLGGRWFAAVFPGRGVMWIPTSLDLLRVDPDRDVIDRRIPLQHQGFQLRGFTSDERRLYAWRGDGTLLVLDAATGAKLSSTRLRFDGYPVAAADGTAVFETARGLVAIDAASGRTRWRADIGVERVNQALLSGNVLWLHATDRASQRDRLLRVDLRDGSVTGALTLPDFGVGGMAAVHDGVWIVSPGGRLAVVRSTG